MLSITTVNPFLLVISIIATRLSNGLQLHRTRTPNRELGFLERFTFRPNSVFSQIVRATMISPDPWSRPSVQDLRSVLENIEHHDGSNLRTHERIELNVPAEIKTSRGNTVPAMTREISRFGMGLLHRGSLSLGEVTVKMASESREYCYQVSLEWCVPCDNGMFLSGGRFLAKPGADEQVGE